MDENLILAGRILFGAFFLIAGIRNFARFGDRQTLATNYGPALPAPALFAGFAVQLVAGLLLIINTWTVAAALSLIAFLIAATALYHNVLMFRGKEREPHIYFALVNATLAGGLMLVIATT